MTSSPESIAPRAPLRALLGDYPNTHALRSGQLTSPRAPLEFANEPVPHKAFKRVVRALEFDVAEIALMTFLMARSRDVPLQLLPVVIFSRNPLPHLICDLERCRVDPKDLGACRIGVRSYTTTTAVWLRAVVASQFAVDLDRTEWITLDEGHVAGAPDPPTVRRAAAGADLMSMLRDGQVDAAIVDPIPKDPRFGQVVPSPDAVLRDWQRLNRARTLNHVVVVRTSLADDGLLMRELFRLFRESRDLAGGVVDPETIPIGFEKNRRNFEIAIATAAAQGLLARSLAVDDLVTGVLASLQ